MTPRAPVPEPPQNAPPYRPHLSRNSTTQSKVPSLTQSNEADDEESLSDSYDMESTLESPQYEGEDTRLTSDKELSGFYMYGWAAEVHILRHINPSIVVRI